ncbi:quinoprotein glucose dehydrogenase [Caulobacter ginsengisoli]|uniref:Quinoprotein glucose dehydrogenase n=1 Tax=Caulobacter ginsengisoli TaxID=400775 RepID=A0ABU0IKZ2_9CAUL|nr:pyrroloquinoline quinone-dependent dehydrogenase [Caulobacter ginsengisoli]MDQ0462686.1 quinoprotein glucose dehydrogenase [Caulobacter ginsengisoli]
MKRAAIITITFAALALASCAKVIPKAPDAGWDAYGGDAGGQRYSTAAQITPDNVKDLKVAWTYSTGEVARRGEAMDRAAFENTPILFAGRLLICSPFNAVSALDPDNGQELWRFDPKIDPGLDYPNSYNCRGLAGWTNPAAPANAPCANRVFMATNDRRLFALDAATGKPCAGFGKNGAIDAMPDAKLTHPDGAQITSPPVVVRGVVIVGSSIDDNQKVEETSGAVHAFDAVTGAPRWSFDPLADARPAIKSGAANVWAPMSVDEARGLVFLPTSSPSPDFYAAGRPGTDGYANSVVALKAETGAVAWAFQTTHHDVWDYDVPAQPTLAAITWKGRIREAVIQTTKQGLIFTLDRDTGLPIIPVEERPVPQGGAPGEVLSPTQPFPLAPAPLSPSRIKPADAFGLTGIDRKACRKLIASARADGLYTPPSLTGTILYPFTGGGSNWGGISFDPRRNIVFVNTSSALHKVTLIPRNQLAAASRAEPDAEISPNTGAPYGMKRELLRSPLGLPCNPPPWGLLTAIDMNTGKVLWKTPLGTTRDLAPFSNLILRGVGTPNFGGPISTGGGLVFIGASLDNYLRAFDERTGKELWRGRLPAGGQATPMTYVWKGRQFVVIAAGGHAKSDTKRGDKVVAFALY